jgi:hypothetical protein
MAIVEVTRPIVGGVDIHLDVHVAAAIDPGRFRVRFADLRLTGGGRLSV